MRVQLAGAALEPAVLKKLKWNDSDLKSESYQYLKSKMIQFQEAAQDSHFVCLMGYRDHRTYVLTDSEPHDAPDYSPPGQYYAEAPPQIIFVSWEAARKTLSAP